jgi:hypothetical protein
LNIKGLQLFFGCDMRGGDGYKMIYVESLDKRYLYAEAKKYAHFRSTIYEKT